MKKQTLLALAAVLPSLAFAAVPAAVTTSITDAGADAVAVATAILVAVFGLLAFKYMRREAK